MKGSGIKMCFPPVAAPARELREEEREDEGVARTSSVLELSVSGVIEASEPER